MLFKKIRKQFNSDSQDLIEQAKKEADNLLRDLRTEKGIEEKTKRENEKNEGKKNENNENEEEEEEEEESNLE